MLITALGSALDPGSGGLLRALAVLLPAWLSLSSASSFIPSFFPLLCSPGASCHSVTRTGCLHGSVTGSEGVGTGWSWWEIQGQLLGSHPGHDLARGVGCEGTGRGGGWG